jgi:protein-disulfide isomerase
MNTRRLLNVLAVAAVIVLATAAFTFRSRLQQAEDGRATVAAGLRAAAEFLSLDTVPWPGVTSDYWLVRSTEPFGTAPINIALYGDPLCSDCKVLFEQMELLEEEFAGQLNVVYYFFPLEGKCNAVVAKDKHPGACDLSYMMAADPQRFRALHDEILINMDSAKTQDWRTRFAQRHGLVAAVGDSVVQARVHELMQTGAAYPPTSSKYAYGIRSTPTLIINQRMIIGTLPLYQLRAILQALVFVSQAEQHKFMESWINPGCSIESEAGQCGVVQ